MAIVDSNIIIYAAKPENAQLRKLFVKEEVCFSLISKVEVLGYHALTVKDKMFFEEVFRKFKVYPLNSNVIDKAVELKQHRKLGLGDALIAATCIEYAEELYTANTDDFKNIKGLKLVNPIKS